MTPARKKPSPDAGLARLRRQVEGTDDALLALISQRMRLAREIGHEKHRAGLPVLDPAREAKVVRRIAAQARELGMPGEEVRSIFWSIIALCRSEQIAPTPRQRASSR
jgi:chorismate mutase/prephenate dehydratase